MYLCLYMVYFKTFYFNTFYSQPFAVPFLLVVLPCLSLYWVSVVRFHYNLFLNFSHCCLSAAADRVHVFSLHIYIAYLNVYFRIFAVVVFHSYQLFVLILSSSPQHSVFVISCVWLQINCLFALRWGYVMVSTTHIQFYNAHKIVHCVRMHALL